MKKIIYFGSAILVMAAITSQPTYAQSNRDNVVKTLLEREKSFYFQAEAEAIHAEREMRTMVLLSTADVVEIVKSRVLAHAQKSRDLKLRALETRHEKEQIASKLTEADKVRQGVEIDRLKLEEDKKVSFIHEEASRTLARLNRERLLNARVKLEQSRLDGQERIFQESGQLRDLRLEKMQRER
jgi:hypothetical protein